MTSARSVRRLASPVRLTLASELGNALDGAWWPRTASIARELPELIDALKIRLGKVIDISVNWSSLAGAPDLDAMNGRGVGTEAARRAAAGPQPGPDVHQLRLMAVTGSQARVNLLVVPCRTTTSLALMVLRQAAALPVPPAEFDIEAFRTADTIVRAARAETAPS